MMCRRTTDTHIHTYAHIHDSHSKPFNNGLISRRRNTRVCVAQARVMHTRLSQSTGLRVQTGLGRNERRTYSSSSSSCYAIFNEPVRVHHTAWRAWSILRCYSTNGAVRAVMRPGTTAAAAAARDHLAQARRRDGGARKTKCAIRVLAHVYVYVSAEE